MDSQLAWREMSQEIHHYCGNLAHDVDDGNSEDHFDDSHSGTPQGFLSFVCVWFLIKPKTVHHL